MEPPLDQPLAAPIVRNNQTLVEVVLLFIAVIFCLFNGGIFFFYLIQSPYLENTEAILIIIGILYIPSVVVASYFLYKFSALFLLVLEGLSWLCQFKRLKNWLHRLYQQYTFLMAFLWIQLLITIFIMGLLLV